MTWDALRKSINGLVNKVNVMNIKQILPEFFGEVRLTLLAGLLHTCCCAPMRPAVAAASSTSAACDDPAGPAVILTCAGSIDL